MRRRIPAPRSWQAARQWSNLMRGDLTAPGRIVDIGHLPGLADIRRL